MRGILTLITLAGSLFFAPLVHAQPYASVTLAWTPSSSPNVAGYDVYYGTSSGNYSISAAYQNVTTATINGLNKGMTYYFAVASYDSNGNQSALSPEISGIAGAVPAVGATLSALASPAGQFSVAISGATGLQCVVQASTDLVNWIALQTNVAPFNFVDSNASQFSRRFYRAVYISN